VLFNRLFDDYLFSIDDVNALALRLADATTAEVVIAIVRSGLAHHVTDAGIGIGNIVDLVFVSFLARGNLEEFVRCNIVDINGLW
jgi:curli biogenesis system outer membrane secretion channel CsgG